ncbi:MAG: hypothetical protein OWQ54_09250 [Sulfolobaceae archaeon]|nr:hypothetical protein [Sulfolobaceae archaeon]
MIIKRKGALIIIPDEIAQRIIEDVESKNYRKTSTKRNDNRERQ